MPFPTLLAGRLMYGRTSSSHLGPSGSLGREVHTLKKVEWKQTLEPDRTPQASLERELILRLDEVTLRLLLNAVELNPK